MTDIQQLTDARNRKVVDVNGEKIGKVEEIYIDDNTGQPEWALVNTGLFGTRSHFVPLRDVSSSGEDLQVSFTKDKVQDAPSIETDGHLSAQEEEQLYRYYGLDYGTTDTDPVGTEGTYEERGTVGHDTSGPTTDNAMTRSEEELRIGTQRREAGRVRLRKHVDTERVTETVPVTHEEVRVEREPVTESNIDDALEGPAISEEEHEVTLSEDQPVVEKRAVPKERIRLDKETVTEQEQVSDEVRKERVEIDEDVRR